MRPCSTSSAPLFTGRVSLSLNGFPGIDFSFLHSFHLHTYTTGENLNLFNNSHLWHTHYNTSVFLFPICSLSAILFGVVWPLGTRGRAHTRAHTALNSIFLLKMTDLPPFIVSSSKRTG